MEGREQVRESSIESAVRSLGRISARVRASPLRVRRHVGAALNQWARWQGAPCYQTCEGMRWCRLRRNPRLRLMNSGRLLPLLS